MNWNRQTQRILAAALLLLVYSNTIYVILIASPTISWGDSRKASTASVISLEAAVSFESLQKGLQSLMHKKIRHNASVSVKVENLSAEQALGLWEQIQQAKQHWLSSDEDKKKKKPKAKKPKKKGKYLRYNICNGLSNQLLIHAAYIARAHQEGQIVQIPDYFVTNGVQTTNENVIPNANNSIPFGFAFDRGHFRKRLQDLGVQATFVEFNFSKPQQLSCAGVGMVQHADPAVVRHVLESFRPSRRLQNTVNQVQRAFHQEGTKDGVCVHHRDGRDWHDHCRRWSRIPDGVYRGNCLGVPNRTFVESLQDRGLDDWSSSSSSSSSRWVYYCGDHGVPRALPQAGYKVLSRQQILGPSANMSALYNLAPGQEVRDLWALVDFFACSSLPRFIGNSVSTFSALQIALKDGHGAYWYNSQSIPLSQAWRVYQIPIVYTYTEMSAKAGQHFLRSSIASVRQKMPHNKIHVLYHGKKDTAFRSWLTKNNVTVHNHDPQWRGKIEEMRRNGDPASSHLFLHPGNYFGTWQRIDIPLFLDTEYCLLLDSDTIVNQPFTLADFGLNMTHGIAMSSEMHLDSTLPSNAGVTLMNIPLLRRTHAKFLKFILKHVKTADFGHSSPSDQGAYLVFYQNYTSFLARSFNMKPYWPVTRHEFNRSFVVHFHGPKPHEYLQFIMGKQCNEALGNLCLLASKRPTLCQALREFAVASQNVKGLPAYCRFSFSNTTQQSICRNFLDALASERIPCSPRKRVTLDDLEQSSH